MTCWTARIPEYVWSYRNQRKSIVGIHGNHVVELFDAVSMHQVTKGRRGLYIQVTLALSHRSLAVRTTSIDTVTVGRNHPMSPIGPHLANVI